MCGNQLGRRGGGPFVSLDLSMIGSWKRFSFFFMSFKERELSLIKRMCCLWKMLRMDAFR